MADGLVRRASGTAIRGPLTRRYPASGQHATYLGVETKDLSLGAIYGSTLSKVGLTQDDHAETECLKSDNIVPSAHALSDFPYLEPAVMNARLFPHSDGSP